MDVKELVTTLIFIVGSVGHIYFVFEAIKNGHVSYRSKKFFGGKETVYLYRKGDLILYCLFILYYCVIGLLFAFLACYSISKYI